MEFFKNKVTQIISWVAWILSTVVLAIGGVTEAEFGTVLAGTLGIVSGVSALVIIITKFISSKKESK